MLDAPLTYLFAFIVALGLLVVVRGARGVRLRGVANCAPARAASSSAAWCFFHSRCDALACAADEQPAARTDLA